MTLQTPNIPHLTLEEQYIYFAIHLECRSLLYQQQQTDHAIALLNYSRSTAELNIHKLQQRCTHRLNDNHKCPVCGLKNPTHQGENK